MTPELDADMPKLDAHILAAVLAANRALKLYPRVKKVHNCAKKKVLNRIPHPRIRIAQRYPDYSGAGGDVAGSATAAAGAASSHDACSGAVTAMANLALAAPYLRCVEAFKLAGTCRCLCSDPWLSARYEITAREAESWAIWAEAEVEASSEEADASSGEAEWKADRAEAEAEASSE